MISSLLLIACLLGGCQDTAALNGEQVNAASVSEIRGDWDEIGATLISFTAADQEALKTVVQAIKKSKKNPGIVDVAIADYLLTLELEDGTEADYYLWLKSDYGAIMDTEDTNTLYSLRSADLQKLNQYIK